MSFDQYFIYDNNPKFLKSIKSESFRYKIQLKVENQIEKQMGKPGEFKQGAYFFSLLLIKKIKFLDYFMNKMHFINEELGLPIFIIDHEDTGVNQQIKKILDHKQMSEGIITKPTGLKSLNFAVFKHLYSSNLKAAQKSKHQVNQTYQIQEEELIPISTRFFYSGKISLFNVYLRMKNDKFLKIVHAGEEFCFSIIENLINKGIETFYIPSLEHKSYMLFHCKVSNALLKKEKNIDQNLNQHIQTGSEILKSIQKTGIQIDHISILKIFTLNLKKVVDRIFKLDAKMDIYEVFKGILNQEMSHQVMCIMWSLVICQKMKMDSPKTTQYVIEACLLHDIGLHLLFPDMDYNDMPEKLSSSQLIQYHTHPQVSVDLLRQTNLFHEIVMQSILYHHQDYQENKKLSAFAQIIGLSDKIAGLFAISQQPKFFFKEVYQLSFRYSPVVREAVRELVSTQID